MVGLRFRTHSLHSPLLEHAHSRRSYVLIGWLPSVEIDECLVVQWHKCKDISRLVYRGNLESAVALLPSLSMSHLRRSS